ncbi:hypothetical protein ABPG75_003755 [Micractinium tetrahymenae]
MGVASPRALLAVAVLLATAGFARAQTHDLLQAGRHYIVLVGRETCNSKGYLGPDQCGKGAELALWPNRGGPSSIWRVSPVGPASAQANLAGRDIWLQIEFRAGAADTPSCGTFLSAGPPGGCSPAVAMGPSSGWMLLPADSAPNHFRIHATGRPASCASYLGALKAEHSGSHDCGRPALALYNGTDLAAEVVWEVIRIPDPSPPPLPQPKRPPPRSLPPPSSPPPIKLAPPAE